MSGRAQVAADYGHFWQRDGSRCRWVIWHTAGDTLVFDTETNCPAEIEDPAALPEILRRMRAAGVPESDEYPGRPCG
ncbi:hypothetical protein [Streptomyces sp. YU58]|uniref:hypothetical protein n=1 Tax=Streptomyces sp. SX92 TaxID=3158972 RepID=UPI0027BA62B1|nr:hypothetical protein [Streptomyces coralus]WLW50955.1 hypothetical protein QU709_06100 [Streptomyces coralus]